MIKTFRAKKFKISFVLRHKWEKDALDRFMEKNNITLGLWVKWYYAVHKITPKPNVKLHTYKIPNSWLLGLNLIIATVWVDISYNTLSFKSK